MVAPEWISIDIFNWVVLPLLIAIARILDVSVGTVRLIFVSRGYKYLAPLLGFVEVIIWLLAIGQIMQQLDNFMSYIGYGAGFAMGNYIGIILVEKMSIGTVLIRVLPKFDTSNLIKHLREANFGVTSVNAEGKNGPIKMLFSIVKRKDLDGALQIINTHNPNAFYTIEEVQKVNEGHFGASTRKSFFFGGIFGSSQMRK
ncbi:MAG: hypothetical protein A2W85_08535 [Bacteroidetes bacterium GWF2_41_31]|nr:MAG: hypothetical protein A2W85_08535 [Bacteroidetes bacterium GWF2_41_31]OFZ09002.1 MAG: hypothetical protein A2338_08450 [Bacteroidetes bacterium RIFOXYB12_FULL_41_6]